MPKELTEADLANYQVTLPGITLPQVVRAAYVTTEDKMPGLLLLKDHEHRTVALFNAGAVLSIKRESGAPLATAQLSAEDRIRDAMAEAQEYPGRVVTR